VIDAQGLLKSALVSWIVGSRVVGSFVAGFDRDSIREKVASFFYDTKVYIPYDKNTIDRNLRVICEPLGIKVTKEEILAKEPFLFSNSQFSILNSQFSIIFVVGASKPNKIYPKEKFLEIAQKLQEKVLVVWGNQDEYETALWLSQNSEYITLDEKGNLDNLKFKIQNSKLIIGGDTGPTHIAWGMNIPSITIFGNTPAYRNTYETAINKTVKSKSVVNPLKLDKDDFSINEIDSNEIVSIARKLLK
jgi:heptosyltransferase I